MPKKSSFGRSGAGAASVLAHIGQQPAAERVEGKPASERSAHTVLVVDDHAPALYATCRMLEEAGFRTRQTQSGEEAIFLAPDASAIVLDVNLPDINGIAVLHAIRRLGGTSHIPVVLTSAVFVTEIHRQVGLDSGADAYLIGPPDPKELASTLDRTLAARNPG